MKAKTIKSKALEKNMETEKIITNLEKSGNHVEEISKIPGDASTRMYFRVKAGERNYILMKMESFSEQGMELPFLKVRNHLEKSGIDVPKVFDVDPTAGCILLEDLGDITLLRHLQGVSSPDVEKHLYERVIDQLVNMHHRASPGPNPLTFDHEKLMWEMGFTIEHFYEKYLSRELKPSDKEILEKSLSQICTVLAREPVVFTHRDFHSRNIMVQGKRLVMIDFQDARLGPAQYDLVSLLRDSYYQLSESQVELLMDYYIIRSEAITGKPIDRDHFEWIFDLMSVQRNFKAIGSFASFLNRRGNATYLKYIGNTFENIRRILLKYPEYSNLREILFHYYYF